MRGALALVRSGTYHVLSEHRDTFPERMWKRELFVIASGYYKTPGLMQEHAAAWIAIARTNKHMKLISNVIIPFETEAVRIKIHDCSSLAFKEVYEEEAADFGLRAPTLISEDVICLADATSI
jgi:hypothetical protein